MTDEIAATKKSFSALHGLLRKAADLHHPGRAMEQPRYLIPSCENERSNQTKSFS